MVDHSESHQCMDEDNALVSKVRHCIRVLNIYTVAASLNFTQGYTYQLYNKLFYQWFSEMIGCHSFCPLTISLLSKTSERIIGVHLSCLFFCQSCSQDIPSTRSRI